MPPEPTQGDRREPRTSSRRTTTGRNTRSTRAPIVSDPYRKGDVFWAPDPFKRGTNPDSG